MPLMYKFERQAVIFDLLQKNKTVSVKELSALLQVSTETIRRDLTDMEEQGLIRRIHGGAVLAETATTELEHPYNIREVQQYREKDAICRHAASFIQDGDLVFIDNSTTTQGLIKHINPNYHVTVVTNSISHLLEAAKVQNSNLTMICLGGIFRAKNFSIVGGLTIELANRFKPNRAFISCRSVDLDKGLYDGSLYELETKKTFMQSSPEVYLLADHTKFQASGPVYLGTINEITTVITDSRVKADTLSELESRGIKVSVAQITD